MALDRIRGEIMAEVKRRKKRKLKRYRIVWPWANNTNNAKKPKKRRRNNILILSKKYARWLITISLLRRTLSFYFHVAVLNSSPIGDSLRTDVQIGLLHKI